jgi:hypothetical protein
MRFKIRRYFARPIDFLLRIIKKGTKNEPDLRGKKKEYEN